MDYQAIYNRLIERSKNRSLDPPFEKHHIIPKCLGGSNKKDNIAKLTPEEHYLAHELLVKIYPDDRRMIFAAHRMTNGIYRTNKLYGWIRRKHSVAMKELMSGENNPNRGKPRTQEQKDHLSRINTGKEGTPWTEERYVKHQQAYEKKKAEGWVKPPVDDKTRKKLSEVAKRPRPLRTPEHCENLSKAKRGKPSHKKGIPVKSAKNLIPVKTPDGDFVSGAEAARFYDISKDVIYKRCRSDKWPEWQIA
jgi:hypothetical protein